jgi:Ran GTPase-activating protein (RanGAP) involved in mRNA processing and transport
MFKTSVVNGELDLSNRNLSDMHSTELSKYIRMSGGYLRVLNLSKNRITDEGMNLLVKAFCESSLEAVDLSSNKITEKCIDAIVGTLKTNKTLKLLDL